MALASTSVVLGGRAYKYGCCRCFCPQCELQLLLPLQEALQDQQLIHMRSGLPANCRSLGACAEVRSAGGRERPPWNADFKGVRMEFLTV
ncbi:unnamed protein product [Rangifer tarandus platyrhynchus]|uniref:Uncharacterized protein n=2 Tax=Rangifer tarandus platyrhynchus TaxID=3082113 RepID=A0ABN8XTU0_RANTA|nr:unnamed protein product [Rangifer tarandus platyrhynchus]CAI9691661.1 unnamed protein product [Rangifer tarandus platyrhynchus]